MGAYYSPQTKPASLAGCMPLAACKGGVTYVLLTLPSAPDHLSEFHLVSCDLGRRVEHAALAKSLGTEPKHVQ